MASHAVLKAVQTGRFTQTRLLVQMGSDVNGKDTEGKTPLVHALLMQDSKIRTRFLRLLLKAGAVVSLADNKKMNALMWACRVTGSEEVRFLLRHSDEDLNLNAQNKVGQTALWIAVDAGQVGTVREMLQALSKHELSSEVADLWGVTPAMRAATLGHLDCLQALIAHLDTTGKSNNTLINVTKINQILKSLSIMDKPETTSLPSLSSPTENQETKPASTPKLPSIRIISTNPKSLASVNPEHPPREPGNTFALFSLEFHRDPTRCSTPFSFTKHVPDISPRQRRSGRVSPVPYDFENTSRSNRSRHGSETERADTPDDKSGRVKKTSASVNFEDQRQLLSVSKRSVSTSPLPVIKISAVTNSEDHEDQRQLLSVPKRSLSTSPVPVKKISAATKSEYQGYEMNKHKRSVSTLPDVNCLESPIFQPQVDHPGRFLLKPLTSVTMVRGSVRDSLPDLFDLIAEQTSESFRKTAVKPRPKKIKIDKIQVPCARSKWSKLRGMALLGGLSAKRRKSSKQRAKPRKPPALKQQDG